MKVTRLKVKGPRASGDSAAQRGQRTTCASMHVACSMRITGCKCCCAACFGARANVSCLLILFVVVAVAAFAFVVIIRLLCNTHTHTRSVPAVASLLSCNIFKRRNVAKFQHTWAHVRWLAENWQRCLPRQRPYTCATPTSTSTTAGNCQTGDADVDANCQV